jgi:hypothetical protein
MFFCTYQHYDYEEPNDYLNQIDIIDWVDSNPSDEVGKVVQVIIQGISLITKIDYPINEAGESKKK